MKRKIIIIVLSVALTLTLIPTLAAYADELDLGGTPEQVLADVSEKEEVLDVDIEEEEDLVDEDDVDEEDSDVDEEDGDVELPKINLKSPVTHMSKSDIGTQFTLIARVGSEVIEPALVTWTSDNASIATVSADGVVTVIGVGKANFTAEMKADGIARNGYAKIFVSADKTKKAKKHK